MQTFSIMAAPAPQLLRDYLIYMSTIKGRSPRTVEAYYNDLRLFLRYLMATRSGTPLPTDDPNLESISFVSISEEMILSARLSDAYSFLAYVQSVNQNNAKTRARKVSSLRGFYKYLQSKAGRLEENPMEQLEIPAQRKSLPKYLTLDESLHLLESIEGKDRERDYCIITILLNCGIRLSELVGIKLSDIRDDTLTVLGKGNKERMVYLNSACLNAIAEYLAVRPEPPKDADKPYLFVSSRTRAPLTPPPGGTNSRNTSKGRRLRRSGLFPSQTSSHCRHSHVSIRWCGYPCSKGNSRPCQSWHHRNIHPCQQ